LAGVLQEALKRMAIEKQ